MLLIHNCISCFSKYNNYLNVITTYKGYKFFLAYSHYVWNWPNLYVIKKLS